MNPMNSLMAISIMIARDNAKAKKDTNTCKRCGEPKQYAKQFGCPVADPKCPHDKKVRAKLKREFAAHKRKAKKFKP